MQSSWVLNGAVAEFWSDGGVVELQNTFLALLKARNRARDSLHPSLFEEKLLYPSWCRVSLRQSWIIVDISHVLLYCCLLFRTPHWPRTRVLLLSHYIKYDRHELSGVDMTVRVSFWVSSRQFRDDVFELFVITRGQLPFFLSNYMAFTFSILFGQWVGSYWCFVFFLTTSGGVRKFGASRGLPYGLCRRGFRPQFSWIQTGRISESA